MAIVKRSERRHYINTGTRNDPVWSRLGYGFSEFSESKNPITRTRRYIHESAARCDVVGYSPVFKYEFELRSDDAAARKLGEITDGECVGSAARVEVLSVDVTEPMGEHAACVREYAVVPITHERGADTLRYKGSLKSAGEGARGVFDVRRGIFTRSGEVG